MCKKYKEIVEYISDKDIKKILKDKFGPLIDTNKTQLYYYKMADFKSWSLYY